MALFECMRYIGIDFGTKKVGIARSDESGRMAFPDRVVKNDAHLLPLVIDMAKKEKAEVILGDSRDMHGNENPIARLIKEFAQKLTAAGIQVNYEPEWYTSKEAERITGRTALTDASAAAIMLNSYLTRKVHHD